MTTETSTLPESVIAQSVFEGLFVHVLKPTGAFADELRRAGYDVTRQEATYGASVWKQCLDIAARAEYPALPREEGLTLLGKRFVEGYFRTIVGRLASVLLPIIGPAGVVKRMPRFFGSGSPGSLVEVEELSPRNFRMRIQNRHANPEFNTGIIINTLERAGAKATVRIAQKTAVGVELLIEW